MYSKMTFEMDGWLAGWVPLRLCISRLTGYKKRACVRSDNILHLRSFGYGAVRDAIDRNSACFDFDSIPGQLSVPVLSRK